MIASYKQGDIVQIMPNFYANRYIDDPGLDDDMKQYAGVTATIKSINTCISSVCYCFDEIPWTWDERWLIDPNPVTEVEDSDITEIFKE